MLLGNISLSVAKRIFVTFKSPRKLFTCHVWCHLCFHVAGKMMCQIRCLHHGTQAPRLNTHGTAPAPTCSTKRTHRHLERSERNTRSRKDVPPVCTCTLCVIASVQHRFCQQDVHQADDPLDDLARMTLSVQWIDNDVFSSVRSSSVTEMTLTAVPKAAYTLAAKSRCECRHALAGERLWRNLSTSVAFKATANAVAPSSPILLFSRSSVVIDLLAL